MIFSDNSNATDLNSANFHTEDSAATVVNAAKTQSKNRLENHAKNRAEARARRSEKSRFQRALFSYHRGDYSAALNDFEKSLALADFANDHTAYVECCTYLLRILAEREEYARIEYIEAQVLKLLALPTAAVGEGTLTYLQKSRALYVLGICNCYRDHKHDQAMRFFREAIDFAMVGNDKEALAAPLYGAASVLYAEKKFDEALRELERLGILLSCLNLPDLNSASYLLRAMIKRNTGALEEALESAWKAFDTLKHHPHLVLYLHTLCVLGTVFNLKGDAASARLYLDLAGRGLKRDEFPRIARLVDEATEETGGHHPSRADLVFDVRTGLLIEKSRGEVRFDGQFVLRDLLRVFLENPGKVFSKEDLAERVWCEPYQPEIHDNKIYVTIKRLRKMIENQEVVTPLVAVQKTSGKKTKKNSSEKPTSSSKNDYILRAKDGYFLNPKTRILINNQVAGASESKTPSETMEKTNS